MIITDLYPPVTIRYATPRDLVAMKVVYRDAINMRIEKKKMDAMLYVDDDNTGYVRQGHAAKIHEYGFQILLAEQSNIIGGYLAFQRKCLDAEILNFYTRPSHQPYGPVLMDEFLETVHSKGFTSASVHPSQYSKEHKTYERYGFGPHPHDRSKLILKL